METATQARASARPIERVRGTFDKSAVEVRRQAALLSELQQLAASHTYALVDTPVLEHTELFLRKSGGERITQLYAFQHRGRGLALRPEFTAGIVRSWVDHLQSEPLPARLAYSGPVFRYEKPQAGRARQFTEFGCELIGGSGPLADAEIIGLALESLRVAGIARPHLVLGHIGVVIDFLAGLDVDQRAQDWLTWSMERLRKGDDTAHELPPHLARLEATLDASSPLQELDDLDEAAAGELLRQAGVQFEGSSRSAEEIVRGLFARRRRRHDPQVLRDAAEFVGRLTQLAGAPAEVLGPLRRLVAERGLDTAPLDELEEIVALLGILGHDAREVTIDLGMGRGLHYYTGMLFEIYASGRSGQQLCGGGRYDDLAGLLGARQATPACGFSLGLERVLAASSRTFATDLQPAVLVL
ncbi:MAG: histidine--tRNA ligase, partial [Chloroflexi bacterium]